jgi:hypothetical protein
MCFFAEYRGERICLKEGRKSMNYNRDYIVIDSVKRLFGLNDLNMRRVKMNKISRKKDKTLDTWEDNTKWVDAPGTIYTMMRRVEGAVRLSWNKEKVNVRELVKIGLFRWIFQVTDFNLSNVLTNDAGELWSVDEHQIGMRKSIFNKRPQKWQRDITKEIVDEVIKDLMENKEIKWMKISEKLKHYKFDKGVIDRCERNYKHLKEDIYTEMKF